MHISRNNLLSLQRIIVGDSSINPVKSIYQIKLQLIIFTMIKKVFLTAGAAVMLAAVTSCGSSIRLLLIISFAILIPSLKRVVR